MIDFPVIFYLHDSVYIVFVFADYHFHERLFMLALTKYVVFLKCTYVHWFC